MCNYLSVSQLSHTPKTYLGPRQIYMMELISENNQGLLAGNYFHKKNLIKDAFFYSMMFAVLLLRVGRFF